MAKFRAGFVSNSSSSSFIVTGPIIDGGVALVFKNNAIINEEQLVEFMNDQYGEGDWDETYQTVINARKAFEKGQGVVILDVEHGSEEVFKDVNEDINSIISEY